MLTLFTLGVFSLAYHFAFIERRVQSDGHWAALEVKA
jgi:hypothetical protein